jgi:hypothetical protein
MLHFITSDPFVRHNSNHSHTRNTEQRQETRDKAKILSNI